MSFRRTESGLTNLHLFFGVDAVVYLEGGESLSREEVDSGVYADSTNDIMFWKTIFSIYRPERKYKFCSIGSKNTVKSIALDIKEGGINNVIVAMDRDFDHINARLIEAENIIYTFGYSWENDAWNKTALMEAFCALSGACKTGVQEESGIIDHYYRDCASKLKWATRIDALLSQYDNSLFDRNSYMRYVKIEKNGMPTVNWEQVKTSMSLARQKLDGPIVRKTSFTVSFLVDCYGHLFAEYAYRILTYLLEKIRRNPKIPKNYATSMVVEKFGQLLLNDSLPELIRHYDSEFSNVVA